MNTPIVELFTQSTLRSDIDWSTVAATQHCEYLNRKCIKIRKSQPETSIGTCSIQQGVQSPQDLIICPHRFLQRGQVFLDALHLLTLHEPGNEIHRVPEFEIPGGSVDYLLVSVRDNRVVDFVGVELQSLDSTGTLWPARQEFLRANGVKVLEDTPAKGAFGVNWKMTAKTILVQLHHKVETFESLGKHLVLILQDQLFAYMRREFNFAHVQDVRLGNSLHFHSYNLQRGEERYGLRLSSRASTDAEGMAKALGLQVSPNLELEVIVESIRRRLSRHTIFYL
jgi:hypothetical protein